MRPKATAEKGQRIYDEKLKVDLERNALGKFAAINVDTEDFFLGDTPEETLKKARNENPRGVFYLIRIGERGAFHLNTMLDDETDWQF